MSIQLKVIADSTSAVAMGSAEQAFRGLAGFLNEDANNDCKIAYIDSGTPSVREVKLVGTWLGAQGGPQLQVQDTAERFDPSRFWVVCEPFALQPGSVVAAKSDIHTPNNTAHAYLGAPFTVPDVGAAVDIFVQDAPGSDANDFIDSIGDYTNRETNLGLFVGGLFFDLVSIADSTHMTIRNRGLAGAIVTAIG